MFLLTKNNNFLFWQPVYVPADAVFDENHELAVVRECNSNTNQPELSEENDNADKGIQNSHEVAYCLYNLYSYNCLSTNFVALLNLSLRSLIQCSLGKEEETQEV